MHAQKDIVATCIRLYWPYLAASTSTSQQQAAHRASLTRSQCNEQESTTQVLAAKAGMQLLRATVQQYLARAVSADPALCGAWLQSLVQKVVVRAQ